MLGSQNAEIPIIFVDLREARRAKIPWSKALGQALCTVLTQCSAYVVTPFPFSTCRSDAGKPRPHRALPAAAAAARLAHALALLALLRLRGELADGMRHLLALASVVLAVPCKVEDGPNLSCPSLHAQRALEKAIVAVSRSSNVSMCLTVNICKCNRPR